MTDETFAVMLATIEHACNMAFSDGDRQVWWTLLKGLPDDAVAYAVTDLCRTLVKGEPRPADVWTRAAEYIRAQRLKEQTMRELAAPPVPLLTGGASQTYLEAKERIHGMLGKIGRSLSRTKPNPFLRRPDADK
jgi:hypothetical protein